MPQKTKFLLPSILTLGLFIALSYSANAQQASYRPKVGKLHPNFALPSIDKKKLVQLESFRGKKLLLFHFASW